MEPSSQKAVSQATFGPKILGQVKRKGDPRFARFLYRLGAMDVGTAFPFLIALTDKQPGRADLLNRIAATVESFLVRRMICRLNTRGYSRLFLDLAALDLSVDNVESAIYERLKSSNAENERWPSDAEFFKSWKETPLYSVLTRDRMRMVLEALEEAMRSERAESPDCPRNLTIEHIMPQAWREHWLLEHASNNLEGQLGRDARIHTIGNLTLLTSKLNQEQSNRPWQANAKSHGKRDEMAKHTVLHLNKEVASVDDWDDAAVDARARRLFKVALETWPLP